jgi:hypothetical protein
VYAELIIVTKVIRFSIAKDVKLNSSQTINIEIMRAFVEIRRIALNKKDLKKKLNDKKKE